MFTTRTANTTATIVSTPPIALNTNARRVLRRANSLSWVPCRPTRSSRHHSGQRMALNSACFDRLGQRRGKSLRCHALATIRDRSRLDQLTDARVRFIDGQHDDRGVRRDLEYPVHSPQTATLGHLDIDQRCVRLTGPSKLDGLVAVASHTDDVKCLSK